MPNDTDMNQLINNLLLTARNAVEAALTLGREYGLEVDLNIVGIGGAEDMWYVSLEDKRRELMEDLTYGGREPTQEELAEIEEELKQYEENGGYDSYGYKVTGWMSSSTNC